jgi:Fe-S cluster assembly ATPase SufC
VTELFRIENLHARPTEPAGGPDILKGVDLVVAPGEVHA